MSGGSDLIQTAAREALWAGDISAVPGGLPWGRGG